MGRKMAGVCAIPRSDCVSHRPMQQQCYAAGAPAAALLTTRCAPCHTTPLTSWTRHRRCSASCGGAVQLSVRYAEMQGMAPACTGTETPKGGSRTACIHGHHTLQQAGGRPGPASWLTVHVPLQQVSPSAHAVPQAPLQMDSESEG